MVNDDIFVSFGTNDIDRCLDFPDTSIPRIELKATSGIDSSAMSQVLNGLKATTLEVGLLFNFGPRPGFKRLIFTNKRK